MFAVFPPDFLYLLPIHIEIHMEKAKCCTGHCVVCSTLPGPLSDEVGLRPLLLPRTGTKTSVCELPVHSLSPLRTAGFMRTSISLLTLTKGAGTLGLPNPSSVLFN